MEIDTRKLRLLVTSLTLAALLLSAGRIAPVRAGTTIVVTPATTPTDTDNDFTRIRDALASANNGDIIDLQGTFDWTETYALADYTASYTASAYDDIRGVQIPDDVDDLIITSSTEDAHIIGAGDINDGALIYSAFLYSDDSDDALGNTNLTIEKLFIDDFEGPIMLGWNATGTFDGTMVRDNDIVVAGDEGDSTDWVQNIAIYFWKGENQTIENNTVTFQADGGRTEGYYGPANGHSFGYQCGTTGGTGYNGLQIKDNTFQVGATSGAGDTYGIWENSHNDDDNSTITISGNEFLGRTGDDFDHAFLLSSQTTGLSIDGNIFTDVDNVFQATKSQGHTAGDTYTFANSTLTRVGGADGIFLQNVTDDDTPIHVMVNWHINNTVDGETGVRGLNELSTQATHASRPSSAATDIDSVEGIGDISDAFVDDNWPAADRFTDPDGIGTGVGPIAFGFNTFDAIQEGVDMVSGSMVNVAAGTYDEYVDVDKSLTLTGQPGAIVAPSSSSAEPIIEIGADDVTVQGFEVDGSSDGGAIWAGIGTWNGCKNVDIKNNTVHDITNDTDEGLGIGFWRGDSAGFDDILIEGNTVYNTDRMGIYVGGSDGGTPATWYLSTVTIKNNEVHDAMLNPNAGETYPGGCGGITVDAAKNTLIEGNIVYDTANTMPGIFLAHGSGPGNEILENDVYGQAYGIGVEIDRGDVDFGGDTPTAPEVHFNSIHDNSQYGLDSFNASGEVVNAENNWWGCNEGPGNDTGCDTITGTVDVDPWLILGLTGDPMIVFADGGTADLTASLRENSDDEDTSADGYVPDDITTTFAADLGSVSPVVTGTVDGVASSTYTAPPMSPASEVVSATVHNETVTLTLTIDQVDLQISKSDGVEVVPPGDILTYTLTITNAGGIDATGVVVTETLPVSTTFAGPSSAWHAVGATGKYTHEVGSLPASAITSTTFAVTVADAPFPSGLDLITNTASVADDGMNGADLEPGDNSGEDVNALDAAPDLVISKTDDRAVVEPGDTVTYTLTVTNAGTQDATGVVVTDTLPMHTDFVTASSGYSEASGVVTWPLFSLAAGDVVTRMVAVRVDAPPWPAGVEVITNTAEVADDGTNGEDPNPGDNTASDVDGIDASPDLFISKDDGTVWAVPGQMLVYKLSYLNNGSQDAAGVVITETVPANTVFNDGKSTSGWQRVGATGVYTFSLGPVSVGTGGAVNFAVTVSDTLPAGVEAITNTVQIGDDGSSGADMTPGDNSDHDQDIVLAAPDLAVAKDDRLDSVEPGQLVTYTLTVENVGTQEATGVVVSDTLPAHTTFIAASDGGEETGPSSGVVTWPTLALAAGDSATRTVTLQVSLTVPAQVETITNTVSAADDGANGDDSDSENNTAVDVDAVEAAPVLALFKADGRTSVRPGEVLTYTLKVKNVGEQDASDLVISDTLPAHTTYITASHNGVKSNGVVVWASLELAVGFQLQRTVTVRVDQSVPPGVTTITNQAEVAGPEGIYDSAQDVDSLVPVPDLILTKDDGEESVAPRDVVTYTLIITNGGTEEATGIVLSDTLPAQTVFVTASHGGDETSPSSGVIMWPTFALAAGDSVSRTVTVQVPGAIPAGVEAITNTASVEDDGTHGPDLDFENNSAEDVDIVNAAPDLVITKTDDVTIVVPGEIVTYTITITNAGDQDATGVVVTDTLPRHASFVAASPGSTFNPADGTVAWLAFGLAVDEVVTRTVTVQVYEALPSGVSAIKNEVVAMGDGGLSAGADDVDTVESAPDLRVVKMDGRTGALPGEVLTYTLTVENVGTQDATGVVLSDTLPTKTSFTGASGSGSEDGGVVTWPNFTLGVGAAVTRTVTVVVDDPWPPAAAAVLTNTASVADDGTNGDDPVSENNTATDITHVWLYHIYLPLISKQ